jgi:hypothetical protein
MEALITALLIFAVLMVAESARGAAGDHRPVFALGGSPRRCTWSPEWDVSQIVGRFLSPVAGADSALRHYASESQP